MEKNQEIYNFPKNFLWGTSTAAHQVEGNNKNSDWWVWENEKTAKRKYPYDPSGIACNSFYEYESDFDLCKQMNNNSIRFSVEWARIEPEEGKFDKIAIKHYQDVIKSAKKRGLKTFVTLHHFTNPIWFSNKGGWVNLDAPKYFKKYAEVCAKEFGSIADFFITINEPQVLSVMAYTAGAWPPQHKNPIETLIVQYNFLMAHREASKVIKRFSDIPVGIAMNIVWWTPTAKSNIVDKIIIKILKFLNTDLFIYPIKKTLDFIGFNYYFTTKLVNFKTINLSDTRVSEFKNIDKSESYFFDPVGLRDPEGIYHVLMDLSKYKLPIYVTENGIPDEKDEFRSWSIQQHLIWCWKAINEGVDLKGYIHWSLLDNYEWHLGYKAKFGLVEIDRNNNLKRNPRNSFHYYSEICKNNAVDLNLNTYDNLAALEQEEKQPKSEIKQALNDIKDLFSLHIVRTTILVLTILIVTPILLFIYFKPVPQTDLNYGITFSWKYAAEMGLDWKETYIKILDELNVKNLRLVLYWEDVESSRDQYNFENIKWQLDEAEKRNLNVMLSIGRKVPRYPECFEPKWWRETESKDIRDQELFEYIKTTVTELKSYNSIKMWQVENEPFWPFGDCPIPFSLVDIEKEVNIVRDLDPNRPIISQDSGEGGLWYKTYKLGDYLGISMYRKIWYDFWGIFGGRFIYFQYPLQNWTYAVKAGVFGVPIEKIIVTELQAEPWGPGLNSTLSQEDKDKTMSKNDFYATIDYAQRAGFKDLYLWGAEWWYWEMLHNNNPFFWETAKALFR